MLRAAFLILVGVIMPILAIQSDRRLRTIPFPPRRQLWASVILTQLILLVIAAITAWRTHLDLLPPPIFQLDHFLAAAALFVAALALIPAGERFMSPRHLQRLLRLGPRTQRDLGWWTALSITAGIAEEFVYRGVLFALVLPLVGGSIPLAALISAAAFALAHAVQGILGAAVIFIFALGFHWLVWYTGSLYYAMAVHILYDMAAGLYLLYFVAPRRPDLLRDDPAEALAGATPPGA
jgi:uncharacterized protein